MPFELSSLLMKTCELLLNVALWLAAVGHLCVLGASFQVPYRLGWKEDLPKMRPFNQKLMYVYGGFTVLTILAFGVLTFLLHDEMLHGERAATALAVFIAIYWTARIGVDFLYYEHHDWPQGAQFVIGHAMLTGLFCALAITYWAVFILRVLR